MTIDLTPFLEAVIALVAALIARRLIPWIVSKTTAEQQKTARALVKTLVYAAEQLYGAGAGEAKLRYVTDWLEAHGMSVDRAEIEAAVAAYLNAGGVGKDWAGEA